MTDIERQQLIAAATAYVSSKYVLTSLLEHYGYHLHVVEDPETGEEFDVFAVDPDYHQQFLEGHYDPDTQQWDGTVDNPPPSAVLPLGMSL